MKKKGFFFLIDMVVAVFVIFIGIIMILSSASTAPITTQASLTSQDVLRQLTYTAVNESNDPVIIAARFNGTIAPQDGYRSILEQVVYLYNKNEIAALQEILNSTTSTMIPQTYNAQFRIDDVLVFDKQVNALTVQSAAFVLTDRRLVLSVANASTLIGPYLVEFTIW